MKLKLLLVTTLLASVANAQTVPWQKMPLLPSEAKQAGVAPGGEGGQWPRWEIAVSQSDPNFLLFPIDVGGVYRSLDGGAHWNLAMQGWNARGANGFAIDPKNADHVLGVGGNGQDWGANWGPSPHGVYLSNDRAATWTQKLAVLDGMNGLVAFDPSSFDAAKKQCLVAYYASNARGLFRSDDGGAAWRAVSRQPIGMSGEEKFPVLLKVHPTKDIVYLGGKGGFFRSDDGGKTFVNRWKESDVWGLSVVPSHPDEVWISGEAGVFHSSDGGQTFVALAAKGIERKSDEAIRNINVSPADSARMLCWVKGANYRWMRYVSGDGGASFAPIAIDEGLTPREGAQPNAVEGGLEPLPYNVREGVFGWHPTDANIIYGLGGDWAMRSTDGGRSFHWWNNGNNGVMVGGSFGISARAPNTVFLGFQDYNGAFTLDGGATWNYRDVSGKGYGGYCYGGFAVDQTVMWAGDAQHWGNPRRLRISRDGGQSWSFAQKDGKEIIWSGPDISFADPKNADVLFASNWRSSDKGVSWAEMNGCQGVYGATPDGRLFGRQEKSLVVSSDAGANWKTVCEVTDGFNDVAFDAKRNRFYFASGEHLKQWENGAFTTLETPRDQYGNVKVETVAVDPVETAIVYCGGPRNIYANAATVCRSRDAGASWENLTTPDGPREVQWIRVHPVTREAWLSGQCFGMWKLAAPQQLGVSTTVPVAAAPRLDLALALPDGITKPVSVVNGDMSAGGALPDGWTEHWGEITAMRDTQTFHSAPASLRAQPNGKSGSAFQMFEVEGGGTYTISGWMKATGDIKAQVAAQSFSPDWGKNEFNQILYSQGGDWTQFSKDVKIPDWASRFNVQLMVEGQGQAWLDDVTVTAK